MKHAFNVKLTSGYGAVEPIRDGKPHNGIDLNFPENTELHAIMKGTVERITDYGDENIGTGIIVKLENGTRMIYGHLNEVKVSVGDKIEPGDLLALSGNTGHSSGPHLHFALWKDGEYLNPTELSDELIAASGDVAKDLPWYDFEGRAQNAVNGALEEFQEGFGNMVEQKLYGILDGIGDFLFDSIYSISLIGGGLLIILRIVGFTQGYRYAGILFTANALIKYLFGGLQS